MSIMSSSKTLDINELQDRDMTGGQDGEWFEGAMGLQFNSDPMPA
jgi:hypothetical protein